VPEVFSIKYTVFVASVLLMTIPERAAFAPTIRLATPVTVAWPVENGKFWNSWSYLSVLTVEKLCDRISHMKIVPLNRGYEALVDDEDYERVVEFNWFVCIKPHSRVIYAQRHGPRNKGTRATIGLHRFILKVSDSNTHVDHINHNGLDCRKSNLRKCTRSENCRNRRKTTRKTTSRFKGVSFDAESGRWLAQIWVGKRNRKLGRFKTEIEAAKSYNDAASELHGPFALLNQI